MERDGEIFFWSWEEIGGVDMRRFLMMMMVIIIIIIVITHGWMARAWAGVASKFLMLEEVFRGGKDGVYIYANWRYGAKDAVFVPLFLSF